MLNYVKVSTRAKAAANAQYIADIIDAEIAEWEEYYRKEAELIYWELHLDEIILGNPQHVKFLLNVSCELV